MKKRKLGAIIVASILIILVVFILLPSPVQNIIIPSTEESGNETTTPFRFNFPWQTSTTQEAGGGAGGAGEGEGGGGGGGGEEIPYVPPKINYTLNIESYPYPLTVRTNYSINNVILNVEDTPPYSVEIESDTMACVLLISVPGTGTIKWTLDGEDCEASLCTGYMGCSMLMNKPHTAIVYHIGGGPEEE
jgi:hypothetical protein